MRGGGEDEQGEEGEKWTHRTVKRRARGPELRCNQQMATTDVSEREARQVAEAAREQEWKLPSFGKELFLGNYRLDLIHPQPRLDAEATEKGESFLATLREFLENEVDPLLIERESKIPDEVVEGLKRIGAMGMKVAEEYGGLGLSQVYYNRALAMIGTWHAALGALVSAHQSIGVAEPLRMFGTDEQKREWLPRVARTDISAFLLTEPDVGSDPARVATTAEPVEGGYKLNGTKLWATNGVIADVVVVMARVPKSEGHKRRDQRLHPALRDAGREGPAPQRVHGPEGDRELGHRAQGRLRARRRT